MTIDIIPLDINESEKFFKLEAKAFNMKYHDDDKYYTSQLVWHQYVYKAVNSDGDIMGGLVGMKTIFHNYIITSMFVNTEYRNQGIGKKLVNHFIEHVDQDIILVVRDDDITFLEKFYKSLGFEYMSNLDYYGDGITRYLMIKHIKSHYKS